MKKVTLALLLAITGNLSAQVLEEHQIGTTYYDLQTRRSMQNRIFLFDDHTIGAVWNMGFNAPDFNDLGIGYNYFDGNAWGPEPMQPVAQQWAKNPSYTKYMENGEIIVSEGAGGLNIFHRLQKGTGQWEANILPGPGPDPYLYSPQVVTTGAFNEVIHLLALQWVEDTSIHHQSNFGRVLYSRSSDGGATWDILHQPFEELGPGYYIGFTEQSLVWAEPMGDALAFVTGDYLTDLIVMKSEDNGNTWQKTVLWEHPYPFFKIHTFNCPYFCCNAGTNAIALNNDGHMHVAFALGRIKSDTTLPVYWYDPLFYGGIGYWKEGMQTFTSMCPDSLEATGNLVGWLQDLDNNGIIDLLNNIFFYEDYPGLCNHPSLSINSNNSVGLTFTAVTEGYDNGTYNYRHIWSRMSLDGGYSWYDFYDLTGDLIHIFDECMFPVSASYFDGKWHLILNIDLEQGLAVNGNHPFGENKIIYQNFWNDIYQYWLFFEFYACETVVNEGDTIHFISYCDGFPYNFNYDWIFEGGNPSISTSPNPYVIYPEQGVYNVTLTVDNTVLTETQTKEGYITVLPATGQGLKTICPDLRIYPNPAGEYLYLEFPAGFSGTVVVSLYDFAGKNAGTLVPRQIIKGGNVFETGLEGLESGVYLIEVNFDGASVVRKLVIR